MTKIELDDLSNRLESIYEHANDVESKVCEILNDLASALIPTNSELTEEAKYQLKGHVFYTLSGAIDALMDITSETRVTETGII